ncbi:MAG TPA: MFS transporter [Bryobacteraceae bacterium]|jgi:sugar phosphate permease|nr:MFS transporter [Bryobacteraceae bacterium]
MTTPDNQAAVPLGGKTNSGRPTHVRHVVLGLTVAAYAITYMDRQILSIARPVISKELGISLLMMGRITFAFRMAYALFQIPGGWLGDRFGARKALTVVVTWWSIFTALTAAAWNGVSMLVIQVFFGLGEAGAFPIATRSLSRWLRPTDRGFAQGVTHAGSRLGSALTPLILAGFTFFGFQWTGIIPSYGWRAAFLGYGVVGVIWSAAWYFYYRNSPEEHPGVNQAERDFIGSGRKRSNEVPWRKILSHGNLWILAVMYFCYNFNLNVYQDWFPTYLHDSRGMTLAKMGLYASLPLLAGTLGDITGGWFSDRVLAWTSNVNLARRWVAIAGFVLSAAATIPAIFTHDARVSVAFYCAAFFGLEWTVGISWAVPLDIGGDFAGSVSAVMNTLGNLGGAISAMVVTYAASWYGWNAPFLVTSALCVLAALLYLKIDATKRIA